MTMETLQRELQNLRDNYLQFGDVMAGLEAAIASAFDNTYQNDGSEKIEFDNAEVLLEELYRFIITNKEFEIKRELGKIIREFSENEKELSEEIRKGIIMERYSITEIDYDDSKTEYVG